jgi:hypothetical protein
MADTLIQLLVDIEADDTIQNVGERVIVATNPNVKNAINLAADVIITNVGRVDYDVIGYLNQYGYSVFPWERDRYGWLLGAIRTSKGIILFG